MHTGPDQVEYLVDPQYVLPLVVRYFFGTPLLGWSFPLFSSYQTRWRMGFEPFFRPVCRAFRGLLMFSWPETFSFFSFDWLVLVPTKRLLSNGKVFFFKFLPVFTAWHGWGGDKLFRFVQCSTLNCPILLNVSKKNLNRKKNSIKIYENIIKNLWKKIYEKNLWKKIYKKLKEINEKINEKKFIKKFENQKN